MGAFPQRATKPSLPTSTIPVPEECASLTRPADDLTRVARSSRTATTIRGSLLLSLALTLTLHGPAQAQDDGVEASPAYFEVQVGGSYEELSEGLGHWRSLFVQAARRFADRNLLYGSFTETGRFSQEDQRFLLGLMHALGTRWSATVEGEVSPSHRVAPRWSALAQIRHGFDNGWGVEVGFRHREYTNGSPNVGILTVERYWKAYRLAYTLQVGQLHEADLATIHGIQAGYYYGDDVISSVAIGFAAGREQESLTPTGILEADVTYVYAAWRHWIDDNWAIAPAVSLYDRANAYTARGASLTLIRRF